MHNRTVFFCLVSNLTRRLMIAESEKVDADRTLETIRLRNDDLRKKYEQLILDNDHRIHLEDHMRELTEMRRLTGWNNRVICL